MTCRAGELAAVAMREYIERYDKASRPAKGK